MSRRHLSHPLNLSLHASLSADKCKKDRKQGKPKKKSVRQATKRLGSGARARVRAKVRVRVKVSVRVRVRVRLRVRIRVGHDSKAR
jgi:hypothetical protein